MAVTIEPIEVFSRIEIDRTPPPALDEATYARVERAWHDLCAQNPRYFNGDILVFDGFDADTGVVLARVDQYKHHAVRSTIDLGISLLAVTAVVIARGKLLVGRRSSRSHDYPGMWELGPSGGVDVPEDSDTLDRRALHAEVLREVREEAGIERIDSLRGPGCVVHDPLAGSSDLVVEVLLDTPPVLRTNWEYNDTRWVTLDELIAWCEAKPDEIIPTTIAHARFLHQNRD